jgi:hypothetical protein
MSEHEIIGQQHKTCVLLPEHCDDPPNIGILTWVAAEVRDAPISIGLALLGAAAGWLVGFLLSSHGDIEKASFGNLGSALIGGLSGYVLSKADKLTGKLFDPETYGDAKVLARASICLAAIILSSIATYNARMYGPGIEMQWSSAPSHLNAPQL